MGKASLAALIGRGVHINKPSLVMGIMRGHFFLYWNEPLMGVCWHDTKVPKLWHPHTGNTDQPHPYDSDNCAAPAFTSRWITELSTKRGWSRGCLGWSRRIMWAAVNSDVISDLINTKHTTLTSGICLTVCYFNANASFSAHHLVWTHFIIHPFSLLHVIFSVSLLICQASHPLIPPRPTARIWVCCNDPVSPIRKGNESMQIY